MTWRDVRRSTSTLQHWKNTELSAGEGHDVSTVQVTTHNTCLFRNSTVHNSCLLQTLQLTTQKNLSVVHTKTVYSLEYTTLVFVAVNNTNISCYRCLFVNSARNTNNTKRLTSAEQSQKFMSLVLPKTKLPQLVRWHSVATLTWRPILKFQFLCSRFHCPWEGDQSSDTSDRAFWVLHDVHTRSDLRRQAL